MDGCLSEHVVLELVAGDLGGDDLRTAEAHLDQCESCREIVARVAGARSPTMPHPGRGDDGAPLPETIGRYRVLRAVGVGGMGTVYAAQDPELARSIAIKLLSPSTSAAADRTRLAREAQVMARLAHPNIVAVHDIGAVGERLFLAMELVEGGTLRAWLASRARSWREIVITLVAAGRGLAAAHAAGVVHRDFKPDNVLVSADGRVRVTDFGLARGPAAEGGGVDDGAPAGTPAYMAPEQLRGGAVDARADQFSFCVTAAEALYGERPSVAGAGELRARPAGSAVPAAVHRAIERGLAPRAAERWPTMTDLLAALEAAAAPPPRRARARVLLALAVVAVAAAAIVGVAAAPRPSPASSGRRSLAVLPFTAEDGGSDGSLSQLLTERVALELGADEALRLVPADEVRRAALQAPEPAALRRRLGCDLVVRGTHRGAALTVEAHGPGDEVIRVEAGDAAEAAAALRRRIGLRAAPPADIQASRRALPSDPEAARRYAEAELLLARGEGDRARQALERALEREPDHPMLHAALARSWKLLGYDARERAAARRAFERADGLPRTARLRIEAQYHEALKDWGRAAQIWLALATFFPDELEPGLSLVEDLTQAGNASEAQTHLARLRQLAPPDGSDPRLDLAEAELVSRGGDREAALAAARRAARGATERGDDRLVARALVRSCQLLEDVVRVEEALAACREAERRSLAAGDRAGVALATTREAIVLSRAQRYADAAAPTERALALHRELGSQAGVARVLDLIAQAHAHAGDYAGGERLFRDAAAIFHEVNELQQETRVLNNLGWDLSEAGKVEEAKRVYRQVIDQARQLDLRTLEGTALANLAIALLRQGEVSEAHARALEAVARQRELKRDGDLAFALTTLGQVLMRLTRLEEARVAFAESLAIRERLGWNAATNRNLLGEVELDDGRFDLAAKLTAQAADEYRAAGIAQGELMARTEHVHALYRLGRAAELQAVVARCRELVAKIATDEAREEHAINEAFALAAAGEPRRAMAFLDTAIARSARLGLVEVNLPQRLFLAELALDVGDRPRARRLLDALRRELTAKGYSLLLRDVNELERRARGATPLATAPRAKR